MCEYCWLINGTVCVGITEEDGTINRKMLGSIVFADPVRYQCVACFNMFFYTVSAYKVERDRLA